MKKRFGVLLCGCGHLDGTDIAEATLTFLEIQESGHEVVVLSLDEPQLHVVNHADGQEETGTIRQQMLESARCYRNKIYKIDEISPKILDALIIPGGQGPTKNLMKNFMGGGASGVKENVASFVKAVHDAGACIGAISLAEFLLTDLFGPFPGGKGCLDMAPEEVLVDLPNKRFLTPGNTVAKDLPELRRGIKAMVHAICQQM